MHAQALADVAYPGSVTGMNGPGDPPALVSRARIVRLRRVMPDESPIDLDAHAAMIAYDVERLGSYADALKRREAGIEVTRDYVQSVRRFLEEIRQVSKRRER